MTGAQGKAKGGKDSKMVVARRGKHVAKDRKAILLAQSDRLELDYSSPEIRLSLLLDDVGLLDGVWTSQLIRENGERLSVQGDWLAACWQSDSDGDYLELQICPTDDIRIDRSVYFDRKGEFAWFADAVVSDPQTNPIVAMESRVPLSAGIQATAAERGEFALKAKGLAARFFPLTLPTDTKGKTAGSVQLVDGELVVNVVCENGNGWSPVLIDWNGTRSKKPATWKRVTVSESREVLPNSAAIAARWQCGAEHLLCYRALTQPELARAVLGMHTWYETVMVRITVPGKYTPLIQIEQGEEES